TARTTFEEGALAANLPSIDIAAGELEGGIGILTLLVKAGLAGSNGEARRHIQGGAVRVNDASVSDEKAQVST
ncbi:S4 domain-containing protein, partial [Proteus mirabilis]|uniref:S4 domain-containing protein n=1 Tax=Proteus mirabilis TaxID=584 RepID=UPI0023B85FC3